ncbi:hypothetical protein VMCG_10943 [Cytospora schulzeri]|uniref:Carboxy-cis,cis-muconate cyclase n=1 Tax=Cytospora schulzeri TaxID=448051 RepID=A0A423V7J1_9PEZI|nr:hypothetical protein VMCG_10943 [Valsa malicola]
MLPKRSFIGFLTLAVATKHNLFVGGFGNASVYSLEFDEETLTLDMFENISSNSGHSWIALSHDKANLYGVEIGGQGSSTSAMTPPKPSVGTAAQLMASSNVYADPFGDCANVIGVDSTGTLDANFQNISYYSGSGTTIWTYEVDNTTGLLTYVTTTGAPTTGANPRHATVHPKGKYLYAVLEQSNEFAHYSIDPASHIPQFINVTYSLLNADSSIFWSDDVAVTPDDRTLWVTSRSRDDTANGTISAYSLSADGAIESRIFLTNTTTAVSTANTVTVPAWSSQYVALPDPSVGIVQIWFIEHSMGSIVAKVLLEDGGYCENAAWVD